MALWECINGVGINHPASRQQVERVGHVGGIGLRVKQGAHVPEGFFRRKHTGRVLHTVKVKADCTQFYVTGIYK